MKPLTYVAVDPGAIQHNLREVRSLVPMPTALLAVVKANGYGHGLVLAGRACAEAGADWLGVSRLEEGVALREAGLKLPVLVFLPFVEEEASELVARGLSGTVVREGQLTALARAAREAGREAHLHLYVDGGLGRPGAGENLSRLLELCSGFPELVLDGVYMHLDSESAGAEDLLDVVRPGTGVRLFASATGNLVAQHLGKRVPVHLAASALTLLRPEAHLDMVRVGTLLYGQYPAAVKAAQQRLDLRPTLELRSSLVAIETLPANMPVGYGGEFRTRRETRVALVPVGYAGGLAVLPESLARRKYGGLRGLLRRVLWRGEDERARIAGEPAPILGRVGMDWCCVDVTNHPGVEIGTEVTLPTRRVMLDSALPRVAVELSAPPATRESRR